MNIDTRRARLADRLGKVADGDRSALKDVYELTSAKLMGVILPITRDRDRSEDILQEVYLKVWHRAGRYQAGKGSPITWLCAIARNSAIDGVRKDGRNPETGEETYPEVEDDAPDAEEALCNQEDRERLQRCLEGLQDDHRKSIRMAYFRGFTYSELAAKLNVPLGTMKSWIRRGLASLKGCLADG